MNLCQYLKGGFQENGARLCSVALSIRTRDIGQKLIHKKFHLNMRSNSFTCRRPCTEPIPQRGCGVSPTGSIQELPGHNPVLWGNTA